MPMFSIILKTLCLLPVYDLQSMSNNSNNFSVSKLILLSDEEFIMHLGKNYELLILNAAKKMLPVVSIMNVNGRPSSLPIERATDLLKKYYKISGETPAVLEDEQAKARQIKLQPDYIQKVEQASLAVGG